MKLISECQKDHHVKMKTPHQHFRRTRPICQYQLLVSYAVLFFSTHYRNRAQIRRSILVNHMYALFILPNHEIQCLTLRKNWVAFFKGGMNERIAYCTCHVMKKQPLWHAARFRHPTEFMWQNPCGKTSSFAKNRLLPKVCGTLQDHLSSFFSSTVLPFGFTSGHAPT